VELLVLMLVLVLFLFFVGIVVARGVSGSFVLVCERVRALAVCKLLVLLLFLLWLLLLSYLGSAEFSYTRLL